MKFDMELVKNAGNYFYNMIIDAHNDKIDNERENSFSEGIECGITITVAALYELDIKDSDIINILNSHWGIIKKDAEEYIAFEKRTAPIRALRRYLELEGYSETKITSLMNSHGVLRKVKKNSELRNLRREPDKLWEALMKLE